MFRTILVPTDGSDHAIKAVAVASDLAAMYRAQLVLLHVVTDEEVPEELARFAEVENLVKTDEKDSSGTLGFTPRGPVGVPNGADRKSNRAAIKEAVSEKILDDAMAIARNHGVDAAETASTNGDPVDRILDKARSEQADAIIMGSRGLSDLKGAVIGSVSHKVSNRASCTCVMVS